MAKAKNNAGIISEIDMSVKNAVVISYEDMVYIIDEINPGRYKGFKKWLYEDSDSREHGHSEYGDHPLRELREVLNFISMSKDGLQSYLSQMLKPYSDSGTKISWFSFLYDSDLSNCERNGKLLHHIEQHINNSFDDNEI